MILNLSNSVTALIGSIYVIDPDMSSTDNILEIFKTKFKSSATTKHEDTNYYAYRLEEEDIRPFFSSILLSVPEFVKWVADFDSQHKSSYKLSAMDLCLDNMMTMITRVVRPAGVDKYVCNAIVTDIVSANSKEEAEAKFSRSLSTVSASVYKTVTSVSLM